MVNLSKFGETLSELMEEHNLSPKELAERAGIKRSNIYHYLRGERLPSVGGMVALADYFNCSVDYILGLSEQNGVGQFRACPPFSERLDFLLKYLGVSTYKIYTETDVSKARFFDWKSGRHEPSLDNVVKLAEVFDCSVDFVLGRVQ